MLTNPQYLQQYSIQSLERDYKHYYYIIRGSDKLIYEKISKLCEERGTSISRLEKECSLGNATIRAWKNSQPGLKNLKKVADYFGVSLDYFLEKGEGRKNVDLQKEMG